METTGKQQEFAIVEQMGHRRFGARIEEVTRFGVVMMRATVLAPKGDGVLYTTYIAGSSLFAVTDCSEAVARKANDGYRAYLPPELEVERQLPPRVVDEEPDEEPEGDDDEELGESEKAVPAEDKSPVCRPCVECVGNGHHFCESIVSFAHNEQTHRAATAGHDHWYPCKHCEAWTTVLEEEEDERKPILAVVPAERSPHPRGACVDCGAKPGEICKPGCQEIPF